MTTSIIELNQLNHTQKWALAGLIVDSQRQGKSPLVIADEEQKQILPFELSEAVEMLSPGERAQVLQQLGASLATPVEQEEEEEDEEDEE